MSPSIRTFVLAGASALLILFSGPARGRAADKAAISQAVVRGMRYLDANLGDAERGPLVLAAYALLKSGAPVSNAHIQKALNQILTERIREGRYDPGPLSTGLYISGIDAMLLADLDPEQYRPQLQMIATFLVDKQLEGGGWTYAGSETNGDTSVTQYAALGLWAAARAGVEVPLPVWDRILMWHMKTQLEDGGFAYVPGTTQGAGGGASTLNMTGAGVGTMAICMLHLDPGGETARRATGTARGGKRFGVLERRETENSAEFKPSGPFKPTASQSDFKGSAQRGIGWFSNNFATQTTGANAMYYYYSMERMAALNDIEELGGVDWYDACSTTLLDIQLDDGSWDKSLRDGRTGPYLIGTSFALLFLTRSTAKLLNRLPREDPIGGGLLAGGRGLPDDLSDVDLEDGHVKSSKPVSPLDELLRNLERSAGSDLFDVQTQIVEQIQLGDRQELVGQTDRLVELVEHPSAEVRRTALWALGRSDNFALAKYAVAALDDPDVDVLVEAHNALCWMSRRPNAFGLSPNPLTDIPLGTSDANRNAAVKAWRRKALENWGKWYLRICPYEQRYEPFALDLAQRLGVR